MNNYLREMRGIHESKMRSLSHVFNGNKKDIDETLNLFLIN